MIAMYLTPLVLASGTVELPPLAAPIDSGAPSRVGGLRRSIGGYSLSLTSLVVGSAIQIETQAGAPVVVRTAASSTEVFSLPAYLERESRERLAHPRCARVGGTYYIPWKPWRARSSVPSRSTSPRSQTVSHGHHLNRLQHQQRRRPATRLLSHGTTFWTCTQWPKQQRTDGGRQRVDPWCQPVGTRR